VRRTLSDALISGSVLLILVVALVSIDPRVRDHVRTFISAPSSASTATGGSSSLGGIATAMIIAARDQSINHAPMMIFVVAATVLFVFMLRT
jgi:hypothetical protein